jgi:hypothetical protein
MAGKLRVNHHDGTLHGFPGYCFMRAFLTYQLLRKLYFAEHCLAMFYSVADRESGFYIGRRFSCSFQSWFTGCISISSLTRRFGIRHVDHVAYSFLVYDVPAELLPPPARDSKSKKELPTHPGH